MLARNSGVRCRVVVEFWLLTPGCNLGQVASLALRYDPITLTSTTANASIATFKNILLAVTSAQAQGFVFLKNGGATHLRLADGRSAFV